MASTLFRGPILQGKKNEAGLTGYNIEQKDSNYTVVITTDFCQLCRLWWSAAAWRLPAIA